MMLKMKMKANNQVEVIEEEEEEVIIEGLTNETLNVTTITNMAIMLRSVVAL